MIFPPVASANCRAGITCRLLAFVLALSVAATAAAHESLWIEAEHFDGIRGYCWPMGPEAIRKTDGHWGLSGPGWAAGWNQAGESGFLSIATGAARDHATVDRRSTHLNARHLGIAYA